MVVVGGRRAEQTQDFCFFRIFEVLRIFGEAVVDLVPKVAQILPKVAPNPWFWFWTYGALPIRPIGPY